MTKRMRSAAVLLAAMLAAAAPVAGAQEKGTAKVSFLEGKAAATPAGGAATALSVGAVVTEGDTVETQAATKLELKMKDGSVVRVGPSSKLVLKSAHFGSKGEKKFSAKLTFGRLWSKVTGIVGSDSQFEVETDNAVAGVRGTTFRVDAKTDKSVLVSVYSGAVAMAAATVPQAAHDTGRRERRQVKGPTQVTREQWEVLVGRMMRMAVGPDGKPGKPEPFTDESDAGDEWAAWNKAMDAK